MPKEHTYHSELNWTGNHGKGTQSYSSYERSYSISIDGKPPLNGSSDPGFRGDETKHNPEEMLLMALSSCHMLWYLHLCSVNKIVVESYCDKAHGAMRENPDGSGEFTVVTLKPEVRLIAGDRGLAESLHEKANEMCFIARSVNFPVHHSPTIS